MAKEQNTLPHEQRLDILRELRISILASGIHANYTTVNEMGNVVSAISIDDCLAYVNPMTKAFNRSHGR